MRGYARSGVAERIREAGGTIVAVTSEPQSLATEAAANWDLDFPAVGDPHHEILETCRDRGWLDLFVSDRFRYQRTRAWVAHPNGFFQPGLLAVDHDGRVLYRWRCRPTRQNMGGAGERPEPDHVWARIGEGLATDGDAPLDDQPALDTRAPRWPLFVLALLAHGWFLRPKVFALGRPGEPPPARFDRMMPRVAVFVAAWLVAVALLPPAVVGLALVAWLAVVVPQVVEVHRQFMHVGPEATPADRR